MKLHEVKVYPSKVNLPRENQLAWKLAGVAADPVAVPQDTAFQPGMGGMGERHRGA